LLLADLSSANEAALLRQRFDANAPVWMKNVANIEVPAIKFEHGRARHYTEYCSGTLLQNPKTLKPRFVISAWHCVEHYQDLSRDIIVGFPHFQSNHADYTARLIDSGGGISNDWAVLELSNGPSAEELEGLSLLATDKAKPATAAGFALALPKGRQRLSFDDSCRASGDVQWVQCTTSKGASGGPIVQTQGARSGIVGVISQGDSQAFTISYPSATLPQRWKTTFGAQLL
jgi:secreted trypsin-like serine protease